MSFVDVGMSGQALNNIQLIQSVINQVSGVADFEQETNLIVRAPSDFLEGNNIPALTGLGQTFTKTVDLGVTYNKVLVVLPITNDSANFSSTFDSQTLMFVAGGSFKILVEKDYTKSQLLSAGTGTSQFGTDQTGIRGPDGALLTLQDTLFKTYNDLIASTIGHYLVGCYGIPNNPDPLISTNHGQPAVFVSLRSSRYCVQAMYLSGTDLVIKFISTTTGSYIEDTFADRPFFIKPIN